MVVYQLTAIMIFPHRHHFPHWRKHLWQIHTKLFLSIIKLLVHSIFQVKEKREFSLDVNYCLLTTIFMMVQHLGYMPLALKVLLPAHAYLHH